MATCFRPSLPGLTRQSILKLTLIYRYNSKSKWIPGSSPGMTVGRLWIAGSIPAMMGRQSGFLDGNDILVLTVIPAPEPESSRFGCWFCVNHSNYDKQKKILARRYSRILLFIKTLIFSAIYIFFFKLRPLVFICELIITLLKFF